MGDTLQGRLKDSCLEYVFGFVWDQCNEEPYKTAKTEKGFTSSELHAAMLCLQLFKALLRC